MTILLWLTAITPPSALLFVSLHACSQLDIYPRWRGEAEALGHLDQIKLVHIEHRAQTVRSIGLQI